MTTPISLPPMTEKEKLEEQVRSRISHMVDEAQDRMEDALFERFDKLHSSGINDDDVIRALRRNGEPDLAESYIEWSGAIDPDAEDDNTTLDPAVPDPGDAASYKPLEEQLANVARIREAHAKTFGEARGEVQWP